MELNSDREFERAMEIIDKYYQQQKEKYLSAKKITRLTIDNFQRYYKDELSELTLSTLSRCRVMYKWIYIDDIDFNLIEKIPSMGEKRIAKLKQLYDNYLRIHERN